MNTRNQLLFDEMKRIHQPSLTMRVLTILLVAASASLNALAQTNSAEIRNLSLEDCIRMALHNNLDLQIDRYTPQIAMHTLSGDYSAYDLGFSLSGNHSHTESSARQFGNNVIGQSTTENDSFSAGLGGANGGSALLPWGTRYGFQGSLNQSHIQNPGQPVQPSANSSASVNVTQPLLRGFWIDSARLTIRVDKNNLRSSLLNLKFQIMQTVTTLEQDYYDLIYYRENVVVQQKAVQLANQLVAENRTRVQVGAMAPLDEKQAESQAASSQAALIAAKSTLAVQENLIKQLISSNYANWATVQLEPEGSLTATKHSFDLFRSWSTGLRQRPDLLQAKLALENAGIQLKYDYNQLFPELDVSATYGYNGGGSVYSGALYDLQQRNRLSYSFGGSITVPLSNVGARNRYKSSKLNLQQAVLTLKRSERDIMREIDDDIKQAQSSYEQVAATRAAREYAEDALTAEEKKLEQGKSTTYTVLQMQRDLTAARGNEIQALSTYNKNLSQLSLDEGTTLDRLGIDLEVSAKEPWR